MAEEIGGFFVGLKAITDEGSFRKAAGNVRDMKDGLAGLIKTGLGIVGVTLGLKELINAASQQGQMLMTAKYVDMSASALEAWNGVMAEAGGSADALINSLGDLNAAFVNMKSSGMSPSNQLFQDIAQLGLSPEKLMGENSDQRAKDMLNAAMKSKDQAMAMQILRRNLGGMNGGLQAMLYAQTMGTTIDSMYSHAEARGGLNRSRYGGEQGSAELRKAGDEFKNIFGAFSSALMKDLAPTLKSLVDWMETHQEDLRNITEGLANLAFAIMQLLGSPVLQGLAMIAAIASGNPAAALRMAQSGPDTVSPGFDAFADKVNGFFEKIGKNWRDAQKNRDAAMLHLTVEDKTKGGISVRSDKAGGMDQAIYAGGLVYQMR